MLFGYLIVRALLVLVHVFGLLPDRAGKAFARLLDSAHKPFDLINYLGSCAGARVIPRRRMPGMLDHVIAAAIFHGMTADAVSDLDLSYTPPLGSPWEAVQMGAQAWGRHTSQH
jgi:hypothetical protein